MHDKLIIEIRKDVSLAAIYEQMGKTPPWVEKSEILLGRDQVP